MSVLQGEYILKSEDETLALANKIAKSLKSGDIIALSGDLGSGKTFLARQIIKALCGNDVAVSSPTFNLLQTYSAGQFEIYHFDLYRLKYAEEVFELGIEEAFSGHVCLIEWPELIRRLLPKSTINIRLQVTGLSTRTCDIWYL
jgi:tRNA threonylcarbamoyladenosine biosynthesis protein TsaE